MTLARTPSFAMNRQDISRVADRIVAKRAFVTFIAILLAALHAALAIAAAIEKSPTFDEPTQVRRPSWGQVSKCDCDLKPAGRILN